MALNPLRLLHSIVEIGVTYAQADKFPVALLTQLMANARSCDESRTVNG